MIGRKGLVDGGEDGGRGSLRMSCLIRDEDLALMKLSSRGYSRKRRREAMQDMWYIRKDMTRKEGLLRGPD